MTTPTVAESLPNRSNRAAAKKAHQMARVRSILLPLFGVLLIFAIWWLSIIGFEIEKFLLPSPADVWSSFMLNPQFIMVQTWVTLVETLQGFILAILIAVPLATIIASSKVVEQMIYPLLLAINAAPKVAIAPLLVVWMGFGQAPKVVMVVLLCFFPIVLATTVGLRSTPSEFIELAKSLGSNSLETFMKFRAPFALEQIFVGLKTAISLAVIGAVIAEFVGANQGLGYLIVQSGASANTALAFVAIVLLAIISIVLFYGLVLIEKLLIPWAESQRAK